MLQSLALIFIIGLGLASICRKLRLPRILGMLLTGILLGPYMFNLLDSSILNISAELRKFALIIILLKAGLSLNLADLKKVGRPAMLMSFVPAFCEITAFIVFAPHILGITMLEAAIMGAVLSAVSPAIVVPRMVDLMDKKYGTEKSIPQMILASSSLDDIFDIVIFTTFLGMAQGDSISAASFAQIPISIISGLVIGYVFGYILSKFFEFKYVKKNYVRNSMKTIIILGMSFYLVSLEVIVADWFPMSGILAVMSMAIAIQRNSDAFVVRRLSEKFGKLWLAAEVLLFVLVGATVDIRYTLAAGGAAVIMILLALVFRSIGVFICLLGTNFNMKEKLYCMIAYIPKATVQAAIGSIPLAAGLACGKIVLAVAVLAIIITAPLGAFGMELTYKRFLEKN